MKFFPLANAFFQREGGGEGPSKVSFWCDVVECDEKLLFSRLFIQGKRCYSINHFQRLFEYNGLKIRGFPHPALMEGRKSIFQNPLPKSHLEQHVGELHEED